MKPLPSLALVALASGGCGGTPAARQPCAEAPGATSTEIPLQGSPSAPMTRAGQHTLAYGHITGTYVRQ
jgi:hypothetical protein